MTGHADVRPLLLASVAPLPAEDVSANRTRWLEALRSVADDPGLMVKCGQEGLRLVSERLAEGRNDAKQALQRAGLLRKDGSGTPFWDTAIEECARDFVEQCAAIVECCSAASGAPPQLASRIWACVVKLAEALGRAGPVLAGLEAELVAVGDRVSQLESLYAAIAQKAEGVTNELGLLRAQAAEAERGKEDMRAECRALQDKMRVEGREMRREIRRSNDRCVAMEQQLEEAKRKSRDRSPRSVPKQSAHPAERRRKPNSVSRSVADDDIDLNAADPFGHMRNAAPQMQQSCGNAADCPEAAMSSRLDRRAPARPGRTDMPPRGWHRGLARTGSSRSKFSVGESTTLVGDGSSSCGDADVASTVHCSNESVDCHPFGVSKTAMVPGLCRNAASSPTAALHVPGHMAPAACRGIHDSTRESKGSPDGLGRVISLESEVATAPFACGAQWTDVLRGSEDPLAGPIEAAFSHLAALVSEARERHQMVRSPRADGEAPAASTSPTLGLQWVAKAATAWAEQELASVDRAMATSIIQSSSHLRTLAGMSTPCSHAGSGLGGLGPARHLAAFGD